MTVLFFEILQLLESRFPFGPSIRHLAVLCLTSSSTEAVALLVDLRFLPLAGRRAEGRRVECLLPFFCVALCFGFGFGSVTSRAAGGAKCFWEIFPVYCTCFSNYEVGF